MPLFLSMLTDTHFLLLLCRHSSRRGQNWAFLTRFCFLEAGGRFEYEFSYPKVSPHLLSDLSHFLSHADKFATISQEFEAQNILLYFDAKFQWPSVYKKNKVTFQSFHACMQLTTHSPGFQSTAITH